MTSIGTYAFYNCTGLKNINLSEGITEIKSYTFAYCTSLNTLDLPTSMKRISSNAFYNCIGFRMLNFNEELESIGTYAFYGCDGLLSMVLNDNLVTLSDYAFANCDNLTSARVPKSVTSFGVNCFYNCPKLTVYCYSGSTTHMTLEDTSYNYFLLDEHEHEYAIDIETEATCTKEGSQIKNCTICGYNYIEILDVLGHDYVMVETSATCTEEGYATYTCNRCEHTYKDSYIEALGHSYGEWIIDKEATVLAEGNKYRECKVCKYNETQTMETIDIDIESNLEYGLAIFTVVNAQTLEPINNAQIFISTQSDGENTFKTDEQGKVSVILPVGKQTISVYAIDCLTRNISINIKSGINEIEQIGLSDKSIYNAEITSELMTLEEIKEAGIDTSDPSNKHVYKYELKLEFEAEIDVSSIVAYFNADGEFIGGYNSADTISDTEEGEGEEPTYNLHYHVINDSLWHTWCDNQEVQKGEKVELTYRPWREDYEDYIFDGWYEDFDCTIKIDTVDIEEYTTTVYGRWIYIGEEEEEKSREKAIAERKRCEDG